MNLLLKSSISAVCVVYLWINISVNADIPCAARECPGESVVCVCNETYNDEIVREPVALGEFVLYTSSKCGLRFCKETGVFCRSDQQTKRSGVVLQLFPEEVFQLIQGFGGSITDSAGFNWLGLPKILRQHMIDSYFGPKGIEYNLIRVNIGGCDFSTHPYTLNDLPECDITLSNFSLAYEDYLYKLPMLRLAQEASCGKTQIIASTWSPPVWMKTNNDITGQGFLKDEYYQTYADYHSKFIDCYAEEGVPIWGITTTNEPKNGLIGSISFNCLGWLPQGMGKFIAKHLGPTIRKSHRDVKIICADDQLYNLPIYFNKVIEEEPEALQYIDGIGVHWYANNISPASLFRYVTRCHPDKFVLATEACNGFITNDVVLGSWERAMSYISDIISDLSYNLVGWIDWNICLDENGGPNWANNFVDSPIIVFKDKKEFVKQPMFYAMGHFSKWIPRGSYRINIQMQRIPGLEQIAFRTPEENIVVVLHNTDCTSISITVLIGKMEATICLKPYSITTMEFPFTYKCFGIQRGYVRPPPLAKKRNTA